MIIKNKPKSNYKNNKNTRVRKNVNVKQSKLISTY